MNLANICKASATYRVAPLDLMSTLKEALSAGRLPPGLEQMPRPGRLGDPTQITITVVQDNALVFARLSNFEDFPIIVILKRHKDLNGAIDAEYTSEGVLIGSAHIEPDENGGFKTEADQTGLPSYTATTVPDGHGGFTTDYDYRKRWWHYKVRHTKDGCTITTRSDPHSGAMTYTLEERPIHGGGTECYRTGADGSHSKTIRTPDGRGGFTTADIDADLQADLVVSVRQVTPADKKGGYWSRSWQPCDAALSLRGIPPLDPKNPLQGINLEKESPLLEHAEQLTHGKRQITLYKMVSEGGEFNLKKEVFITGPNCIISDTGELDWDYKKENLRLP